MRRLERERMVAEQIEARGVGDERVLEAMRAVPRERFVPKPYARLAYEDCPLPIGKGQTISQPYIVAYMTSLLELSGGERVLEIGTGSGYQSAILAELAREVYTVEILESLSVRAQGLLAEYENIRFRVGDGSEGWFEHAPFDRMLVTAAPTTLPASLPAQLRVGGSLVAPVGGKRQDLVKVSRLEDSFRRETKGGVRFVPLVGKGR